MNKQVKIAIIAIIIIIPLSSYSVWATDSTPSITKSDDSSKILVFSSFYPLYEFAKQVGQDKVDVRLLVSPGVEPHDWEPTIQDVKQMQRSDMIIINGFGFENWVKDLVDINYSGKIVDTSKGINSIQMKNLDESSKFDSIITKKNHNQYSDPHIWLDPVLAKIQVQNIANAFSEQDPKNQKFYQENAQRYIVQLDKLDKTIREKLSTCNHDFIAFHNAFSYFANEYDLTQHTIVLSNDPLVEPTAKTLEDIINKAKELQLQIIFTEETVDPRISNVIANEIGGKILVLSPIEIADNENYISKMNKNLDNLKEALC